MNESDAFNKRVETIQKILEDNYRNLDKIKEILGTMGKELKRDMYKNVEGVVGTFDGFFLVDSSGNKHEIPANYAAKSRLVYGDSIKMVEDNGTTVFKQIQKVERKKSEGVISKKEGKWVVLTDTGSYRISDVAADFNQIQLNDEVVVFIPAGNLNAPFATLDRSLTQHTPVITNTPHAAARPSKDSIKEKVITPPVRPLPEKKIDTPKPVVKAPIPVKKVEPAVVTLSELPQGVAADLPLNESPKEVKPVTEEDDLM